MAKDDKGFYQLIRSGRLFTVRDGTEVRIIDMSLGEIPVRILSGEHYGEAGGVARERIR